MTERRKRLLADGLVGGLVGYVMVVAFFTFLDVVGGRPPLYTGALLGEAMFAGLQDPGAVGVDPGPVLAFNGVHLVAVLAFSFFGAWLVYEAERHPQFWYVALFLFLAAAVFGYAGILAVTVMVGAVLSPWLIASAGLLSALGVAGWLIGGHWELVRVVRASPESGVVLE
jgi:hypothetical protein